MEVDVSNFIFLAAQGIFYFLLFLFTVHALILAYHWFNYGTSKKESLASLALYLSGGAIIFLTLAVLLGTL